MMMKMKHHHVKCLNILVARQFQPKIQQFARVFVLA